MIRQLYVGVCLVCVAVFTPAVEAQTFDVIDLGTLVGTDASTAMAINDSGLVVGLSGADRLFTWQQATRRSHSCGTTARSANSRSRARTGCRRWSG